MNLNLSLIQLAEITDGTLIGPENLNVHQIIIDTRSPVINQNTLFIALKGNNSNGHLFIDDFINKGGELIMVSKKQNLKKGYQIIVKDTLKALQQIAIYHRSQFDIPIIGITGSNGKTIVKEWLYHVLKEDYSVCRSPKSYNSQIGVPLSILQLNKNHQIGIFEAGISKPNEMEVLEQIIKPTIGVFTGIGDAHQSNFKNLKHKKDEKYQLFKSVDFIVQNSPDDVFTFDIPFDDEASLKNALLVFKTATTFVSPLKLIERLNTLPKISMRLEKMVGKNQNIIINDAYSLDEKSLEIGLQFLNQASNLKKRVLFIAPSEQFNITAQFQNLLNSNHIDAIIFIGKQRLSNNSKIHYFNSVQEFKKHPIQFKNTAILFTGSRSEKIEQLIPDFLVKNHVTKLNINLSAIQHNLNFLKLHIPHHTMILAMVKAQSYGSGIVEMAQFLEQQSVNYFGVAYTDEGVLLKQHQISTPILVMNPEQDAFEDLINHNLEPSIYSLKLLNDFIGFLILKGINNYPIHIKIDTGMHRLGFVKEQVDDVINTINTQPEVYVKSIFSHFSAADDMNDQAFTLQQIQLFEQTAKKIENRIGYPVIKHLSNSIGIINYPQAHFDMVRIGIGMFGLIESIKHQTENALSFTSQISQIKNIKKGDRVGYGHSYVAHKDITIAIVPVGYADGLNRALSNGNWFINVNGHNCPIIGLVCMDMCIIDISAVNCKEGDEVEIFGKQLTVFKMAKQLNTIPYEIISSISNRVHRVYIEE